MFFAAQAIVFTNVVNPRSAINRKRMNIGPLDGCSAAQSGRQLHYYLRRYKVGEYAFIGAGAVVTQRCRAPCPDDGRAGEAAAAGCARAAQNYPHLGAEVACSECGLRFSIRADHVCSPACRKAKNRRTSA